jgi:hypothetical protein
MTVADMVRRMGELGFTPEQIAQALECFDAVNKQRRARNAERMRAVRARARTDVHVRAHPPKENPPIPPLRNNPLNTHSDPTSLDLRVCSPPAQTAASADPTTWKLDEADRTFARNLGWPDQRIETEFEHFRDHALSKGRHVKNRLAAWRNWCRSPFQQNGNGNAQSKSVLEAGRRIDAALRAAGATGDYIPELKSKAEPLNVDQFTRAGNLRRLPPR